MTGAYTGGPCRGRRRSSSSAARARWSPGLWPWADGVGDYVTRLRPAEGELPQLEPGDRIDLRFAGIRSPIDWPLEAPRLASVPLPGTDRVRVLGPPGAAVVVAASIERSRIVDGLPGGGEGGGRSHVVLGDDGETLARIPSAMAEPLVAGPGTRFSTRYEPSAVVAYTHDRILPLLGVESRGANVALLADPGLGFELRLSDPGGGQDPVPPTLGGRVGEDGLWRGLWADEEAIRCIRDGASVDLVVDGRTETVRAVDLTLEPDWELNLLDVRTEPGRPIHSASGTCLPWPGFRRALSPLPDSSDGDGAISAGEIRPGTWFVAGVFGDRGHFHYERAIRPQLFIDPAGILHACATPYEEITVEVRDEGGQPWARGEGVVGPDGWVRVVVRRAEEPVAIRRTDTIHVQVEGASIEKHVVETFAVERRGDSIAVRGEPGRTVAVFGDVGFGFGARLASAELGAGGRASLRLPRTLGGVHVVRWLVAMRSAEDDGHGYGRVLAKEPPPGKAFVPFARR